MNGFTAVDMSTAAANWFRDGLAAQPAAAQEVVAWVDIANWKANWNAGESFFSDYQDEDTIPLYAAPVAAAPVEALPEPYGWHLTSDTHGYGRQESFTRHPIMTELVKAGMAGTVDVTPLFDHSPPKDSTPAAPGIDLADISLAAQMLSWGREEGLTETQIAEIDTHQQKLFDLIDASPKERAFLQTVEGLEFDAPMDVVVHESPKGAVPRSDLVPGVVRCAKCSFQLARTNLYLGSGTTGPGDSKTEPCPNGCGPLWPVTWQTWATEGWQQAERYLEELRQLQAGPKGGSDANKLRVKWLEIRGLAAGITKNLKAFAEAKPKDWCGALDDSLDFADLIEKEANKQATSAEVGE